MSADKAEQDLDGVAGGGGRRLSEKSRAPSLGKGTMPFTEQENRHSNSSTT